jgi:P27 family predicted phage terminase small subunit
VPKGGSNRKSTRLHVLHGTGRPSRQNKGQPQPTPGKPSCPRWLSPSARAEWRRVAPELDRMGLLTILDRAALAAYCTAYARWQEANAVLAREGMVIPGWRGALRKHPCVTIMRAAEATMRGFAVELGLTPLSRGRLSVPPPEKADPFEEFLKGGGHDGF